VDNNYKKIWVGYSGGVDSHVLLHKIRNTHKNVHAVHINHQLSSNADAWQQHCADVCKKLEVTFTSIKVDATPKKGQSPEDAAREARYGAWQDIVQEDEILCTAHHADDQVETILFRLFRGTGPKGLTGIASKVNINGINIERPILNLSKEQILEYANDNKLEWITDESNSCNDFDRNFIRNELLAKIKQRWPAVVGNIVRTGELCSELVLNLETEDVLDLKFWQKEKIRAWLLSNGINPSVLQVETIINEVVNARQDAQPKYMLGSKVVRRFASKLYLLDKEVAESTSAHGKKAKKRFQEQGIPPWERGN